MKKHTKKENIELSAEPRAITGSSVSKLRAQGVLPAVLYGKGIDSQNIQIPLSAFRSAFAEAGESTLIYLNVGGEQYPTIVADVTRDPITYEFSHADFRKVSLSEKVKAMVPVEFVGEAPAVKDLKGIFVRSISELEVEALPQNLPHEITVDISALKTFQDQILVRDIVLEKAHLLANPDEVIALVQEPKSEEELQAELAEPTTDVSAVEEIKKEKPAEEGEGEAAPAEEPAKE